MTTDSTERSTESEPQTVHADSWTEVELKDATALAIEEREGWPRRTDEQREVFETIVETAGVSGTEALKA